MCYSRKYFGIGSRQAKRAGERNGARKSKPAQKPLNFKFRPCEVTSLNCQGIKYLTNTSEAKCKQTRLWQAVTAKSLSTLPVQTASNIIELEKLYGRVWKRMDEFQKLYGQF